ncbi:putative protein-S-isoprenylcysteine O-methyltransferase [Helianthus annuus]|nr:putative protein-S-isoprenylcysteine O-methyltransferase [Helianthus annuus]KAJ0614122.1 putative protein-S-isoprenylcysteine O-methyltransferase [Helianthus annuus]KAJ0617774.1 putative protein-S-isoprenylcysteine O-methyltransferase [Helianthus annuus]KAJ0950708.1 putative protein-S-isoprenylcysteine O-methyltransferase [Helianthus annuus]
MEFIVLFVILGFLIWSVGTQVMLCNPVSTVAFTVVVWNFFHEEEFAKRVPSREVIKAKIYSPVL